MDQVQQQQRKRGSERDSPWDEPETAPKPLKAARSQAEITRVRQGYTLITIAVLNMAISIAILVTR